MDTKGDKTGRREEVGDSDGHVHSTVYKIDSYCIAPGTLFSSLWAPEGRKSRRKGLYVHKQLMHCALQ